MITKTLNEEIKILIVLKSLTFLLTRFMRDSCSNERLILKSVRFIFQFNDVKWREDMNDFIRRYKSSFRLWNYYIFDEWSIKNIVLMYQKKKLDLSELNRNWKKIHDNHDREIKTMNLKTSISPFNSIWVSIARRASDWSATTAYRTARKSDSHFRHIIYTAMWWETRACHLWRSWRRVLIKVNLSPSS